MTRGPLLFLFKYTAALILTSVVQNQISSGSRAPELHFDPFYTNNTLLFFRKFKGKLTHMDSGKMSFETEFLYTTAEWDNKLDKK